MRRKYADPMPRVFPFGITILIPEKLEPMSVARKHHEWLSLIEHSGPFLSPTVIQEVFPQGLEPLETDAYNRLKAIYDERNQRLRENPGDFSNEPGFCPVHPPRVAGI